MGKGDKKSRRGKVTNGSYGKSRMRKASMPLFDKAGSSTEEKVEKKTVAKKKEPVKKAAPEPKVAKAEKAQPVDTVAKAERSDKEVNAETSEKIKH